MRCIARPPGHFDDASRQSLLRLKYSPTLKHLGTRKALQTQDGLVARIGRLQAIVHRLTPICIECLLLWCFACYSISPQATMHKANFLLGEPRFPLIVPAGR
jgi:hypothetical protein